MRGDSIPCYPLDASCVIAALDQRRAQLACQIPNEQSKPCLASHVMLCALRYISVLIVEGRIMQLPTASTGSVGGVCTVTYALPK